MPSLLASGIVAVHQELQKLPEGKSVALIARGRVTPEEARAELLFAWKMNEEWHLEASASASSKLGAEAEFTVVWAR